MSFISNHGIEFSMREANFESPVDFDIVNKMGDVEIVFHKLDNTFHSFGLMSNFQTDYVDFRGNNLLQFLEGLYRKE
ncbi:hypothetical protein CPT03_17535 [Pedobacter ginsengisoli]|uniref:Uncharacterized protein n=1 Tax=Pedobacter ginsengisoli TaxID=363852 RepID=A0A2D1U947_9SPHI|nr:hypothetical protein [Pedobacter ginsengisoli]ATP58138.1 hypothetical protein CPT03_17535 [Pedobacter ginsengisoli]